MHIDIMIDLVLHGGLFGLNRHVKSPAPASFPVYVSHDFSWLDRAVSVSFCVWTGG